MAYFGKKRDRSTNSYQAMLKGRESSQNLENVQSSLKSLSKNVPAKTPAKIRATKFPQIVYEKCASIEQGGLIVVRKGTSTNIAKKQATIPQVKKKSGRPRKQPGFYKDLIEGGNETIIPIIKPTNAKYMTRKGQNRDDPSKHKRIRRSDELDLLERARTFDWKNYGKKLKNKSDQDCYKCHNCIKKIKSIYNFYFHNLKHNGQKPLKCQFCDKGFVRGVQRHKHEESHNKGQIQKNQMEFKRSRKERNENINRIKAKFSKSKIPDELALLESMRNGAKMKSTYSTSSGSSAICRDRSQYIDASTFLTQA